MWMFLGLFAAMAMSSVSDMFMAKDASAREDDDDDPQRSAESQAEAGAPQSLSPGAALIVALDADLSDDRPADPDSEWPGHELMGAAAPGGWIENTGSDMSLFDDLDERTHSSDQYPPARLPASVQDGGAGPPRWSGCDVLPQGQVPSDMGLFDDLDERIHSSDLRPPAESPSFVQGGGDEPPPESGGAALSHENRLSEIGLFDDLDERIHSSDDYPPAQPPAPVVLEGGEGDDLLRGSGADDSLSGGAGNDTLIGAGGNNLLQVDSGNNLLRGGEGNDVLLGGTGNDTLEGGWGDDLLVAGGGDNLLMGGAGNDTLVGVKLDDQGQDQSGVNILNGGAGDDLLIAGQGDILHGGAGADTFALGDWLAQGAPVTIVDYTVAEDQFVLHYDPARMLAPEVAVSFDPAHPDTAEIRLNGHVIAYVANAPDLRAGDIMLVAAHPAMIAHAAE